MLRRSLLIAIVVLAALGGGGCSDQASSAARIGDTKLSYDDLMAEVEIWAGEPWVVQQLGGTTDGAGPGSYDLQFVDAVLSTMIRFQIHENEFENLGLEVTDEELAAIQGQAGIPAEVDPELTERLVRAFAQETAVQNELAEVYGDWFRDAFRDVEVSSRFGEWNADVTAVLAPEGPQQPPPDPATEL